LVGRTPWSARVLATGIAETCTCEWTSRGEVETRTLHPLVIENKKADEGVGCGPGGPPHHWGNHAARVFLLVLLCAANLLALDLNSLKPQGYVSDFAHVLDAQSRAQLETYCGRVEQTTGVQMAMVILDSLDGEPIEDVTNTLYRKWGVGQKGKNEGIMFLVAIKDHRDRIEVGYGLEPILPDGFAGGVLREFRPLMQQRAYGQAMLAAAQEMGTRIATAKGVSLDFSPRPSQRVF
jgi:uncharacterized membrane protein YgcG